MKYVYGAGVITYYEHNGDILFLVLRKYNGEWDLPKGKCEPDEKPLDTAQRELFEETGLVVVLNTEFMETIQYSFHEHLKNQLIHKTVFLYLGKTMSNQVVLSQEHQEYMWISKQEIKNYVRQNYQALFSKVFDSFGI